MKMNVESFNLDHTKVKAPYVRVADRKIGEHGDIIVKYDVRFKQPNKEHMDMPSLHSLEHLVAELIRNHANYIVDWSPMGCQTGFYLTVLNHENYEGILEILEQTMQDVLKAKEVPASNEKQCGWAANHTLEGAQNLAREFLAKRNEWSSIGV
ncbi:S-ribosylhomocysteine lyase LuxS [Helicobacter suis]|uniref:S-ribosylhomocysteine lyase n=2 Tax=Helicobacter suis TaxID=104628 RepID=E7G2U1_9HELI|nr:S-ribosylhomocysteine lyase [Helicobacter suis]EFX42327.1 S-ribosylhomocysteinase [Helicobacter suis HS5]BCD46150.1 S-ribosylhomocysteine lyase LuxS [Helicobacter suis]BCD47927.1 S-ribosylhomocysteine lyase LuxS [Helicobacter suis]BCD49685.1 S-ribosylhomocysteine lyase LuxS [Helicobacter suis]BCD51116.1 S-ribosylhomocysteine lyase LuxS [Helicobacter suis]